jgi:hypothetical protein
LSQLLLLSKRSDVFRDGAIVQNIRNSNKIPSILAQTPNI